MPKQPPRVRSDTLRLKREVASLDSTFRALRSDAVRATSGKSAAVLDSAARATFKKASAKMDTVRQIRGAAPKPSAGHKSFAKNTEGFDGAALGERPPRMEIPRGNPTPDTLPRATGTPALAQRASGTDNLRATTVTKRAETRSIGGGKSRTPAGVQNFDDSRV